MTKKIAIINSEIEDVLVNYFTGKEVEVTLYESLSDIKCADIVALYDYNSDVPINILDSFNIINLHFSLLPAFACDNALRKTFTSGIKVSGVTVHYVGIREFYSRIIAQYPVLIGYQTHYNEYSLEMHATANKIYPMVIDAVLEDKVFDFSDLFKSGCSAGGCGKNCSNCSH